MVRFLKAALLAFAAFVFLTCVGTVLYFQACSGRMSACYQAWNTRIR